MKDSMRPVWYFVGLLLVITGGLVILGGITDAWELTRSEIELHGTHANYVWGGFMVVVGVVCLLRCVCSRRMIDRGCSAGKQH